MFISTNIVQLLTCISASVETVETLKETFSKGTVAELTKGTEFDMHIYYWFCPVDKKNNSNEIDLIDRNGSKTPLSFNTSFRLDKDTVVMINNKPYRINNYVTEIFLNDVKFTCSAFGSRLYVKNNLKDQYNQAGYEIMSKNDKYHVHAIDNKYTITQIYDYVIPTLKDDAFYSAVKLNKKQLKQITTNTPSMFMYRRNSWGYFGEGIHHGHDLKTFYLTASGNKNIFTFKENTQVVPLEVKEQEINENMVKLTQLKEKDMLNVSTFDEFVEIFEFYEKARFNIQLKEAKKFCTMFRKFSQEFRKDLLENDQFDTEKRKKMIYSLDNIECMIREDARKANKEREILGEYKLYHFSELVDKILQKTTNLYDKYEKYEKIFTYLAKQRWEMICSANQFFQLVRYKLDKNRIGDDNSYITVTDIEKYETYSPEKLDEFKRLIETILSEKIWSIAKVRALYKITLKFINDFVNKKSSITDKVEIEKMTEFIIQMRVHLIRLRQLLEFTKGDSRSIRRY